MSYRMMARGGSSSSSRSSRSRSSSRRRRSTAEVVSVPVLVGLLLVSFLSTPASGFGIGTGGGIGGININGVTGLNGIGGTGTGTTSITAGNSFTELFESIAMLTRGGVISTDLTSGTIGGVAGSLALLAAAIKAPLVALYQISAEVVVMVALILFISYIASLLGIDDFRRRTGLVADPYEAESTTNRGFFSNILESEMVQDVTNRVYSAIENFDLEEFLEALDDRQ